MISQKINTYKNLIFWQRAREVSLLVVTLTRELPNERIAWILIDQIIRSSFSVGANITEGFGKYKGREYRRFIQMALGSAQETEYWLEMIRDIYPQTEDNVKRILLLNEETIKILISTVKKLNKD